MTDFVEKTLRKLRSHRLLAPLILLGIVVIALGETTNAIESLHTGWCAILACSPTTPPAPLISADSVTGPLYPCPDDNDSWWHTGAWVVVANLEHTENTAHPHGWVEIVNPN